MASSQGAHAWSPFCHEWRQLSQGKSKVKQHAYQLLCEFFARSWTKNGISSPEESAVVPGSFRFGVNEIAEKLRLSPDQVRYSVKILLKLSHISLSSQPGIGTNGVIRFHYDFYGGQHSEKVVWPEAIPKTIPYNKQYISLPTDCTSVGEQGPCQEPLPKPDVVTPAVERIVEHYNVTVKPKGKARAKNLETAKNVRALLRREYDVETICAVITLKNKAWKGDPVMDIQRKLSVFLRPSKFENYVEELPDEQGPEVGDWSHLPKAWQ